jgi:hypothetical protein
VETSIAPYSNSSETETLLNSFGTFVPVVDFILAAGLGGDVNARLFLEGNANVDS